MGRNRPQTQRSKRLRFAASTMPGRKLQHGQLGLGVISQAIFTAFHSVTKAATAMSACSSITDYCYLHRQFACVDQGPDCCQRTSLHSGEDARTSSYMIITYKPITAVSSLCLHAHMLRLPLQGSLIYKDHTAQQNDPLVAVLLQSGAIILGKTNTPESGAGANTFNEYVLTHVVDQCTHAQNSYSALHTRCTQHSATAAHHAIPIAFE